jgi:uroporphyrinogen decarboxylase
MPMNSAVTISDELYNSPFLRACRREPVPHTPIWLMRQAGRYQASYRELRQKISFLELCKTPELATKVTVEAVEQTGVDAAIIFSDILPILEPMGASLEYVGGSKPQIHNPVRNAADIENLRELETVEELNYVYEALRQTRRALPGNVPLIGFCGAPFTLASYLIEGGGSKNYVLTKSLMYRDAGAWNALLSKLARALVKYLNAQIAAGANAVQIFDSWVGCLSPDDYREYVLPHTKFVVENIEKSVPIIHFGTGTATLLKMMRDCGDVIGVDWHSNLADAWQTIGFDKAAMGNLDPVQLFAPREILLEKARKILEQAAGRNGHIFNLGHGILPETPMENVTALVDFVHEFGLK